jgi:regulator of protease activity HflC (stomatin/prohibitin superfamily)
MESIFCFLGAIFLVSFVFLTSAIKIVPEYQRFVVFRLGRVIGSKGPGIVVLIPMLDRVVRVDLREQTREVKNVSAVTKDNSPVTMDYVWNYKVIDPAESVLQVGNFESAATGIGATILRKEIGEVNFSELSSEQAKINKMLYARLYEVTERWGVKVTKTEIQKLVIDDHRAELEKAHIMVGTIGETQTTVHTSGTALIDGQAWDAISERPIAPKSKVRIKRVILEVEESASN